MPRLRRMSFVLLLAAILAAAVPAEAAKNGLLPTAVAAKVNENLASRLWGIFTRIWGDNDHQSGSRGTWSKNGCNVDPNGQCLTSPNSSPLPTEENGCNVGPDGVCIW
jgi:hypothetical protein